jgi:putative tryptophan/tyrosine transport system substrate-binding protein
VATRRILAVSANTEGDFDAAFGSILRERADAMLVNSDVFLTSERDRIFALAAHHALPAIYPWREYTVAGGLISYGPSLLSAYRQLGVYAGKILKGSKTVDLPVIQPTSFELIINIKTAKALGLNVPPTLLAIADEVIE